MRRPVVASAILATLLTLPLGSTAALPTSATPAPDSERATAPLRYLCGLVVVLGGGWALMARLGRR